MDEGAVRRHEAGEVLGVLYEERKTGERARFLTCRDPLLERARLGDGRVVATRDHRVKDAVERVDALDRGADQLDG